MGRIMGALALSTALLALNASEAGAQQVRQKFKDQIRVVQPKPVLQKKRFELAPRFGVTFNDALYRSFKVGGNLNYHITERITLGLTGDYYGFEGALEGQTSAYRAIVDAASGGADALIIDTPIPKYMAGLEVGWTPIFGKFAIFNSGLGFYDLGVTLGGAYVGSESFLSSSSTAGPGVTASIFSHIFLNEWVSLNFEIRELAYFAQLRGEADTTLSHAVTASVGLGFYFPTGFTYTEAEGRPADE